MTVRLADLTTLRLGGPARRLVVAATEQDLVAAVREADERDEPVLVLAGGSNVVIADAGFEGTVVQVATRGVSERDVDGRVELEVEAGEPWDPFVARCVAAGLAGIECLSGIPGSTGATPIQNVGAYGQEVSDVVVRVRAYDRFEGCVTDFEAVDCSFGYRSSRFKREAPRWIVLKTAYALDRSRLSKPVLYRELAERVGVAVGERAPLDRVREAVLALRRSKGMVVDDADPDSVSAGSFFTNPVLTAEEFAALEERIRARVGPDAHPPRFPEPDGRVKTSAAWLIERAGFRRGHGDPRAIAISSKHTLALTNRGEGTTELLVALAREIAAKVEDEFGVRLVPEPVFVGCEWG